MKYRCLLVDDEPPARKLLSDYISKISQLELAGVCKNGEEALRFLKEHPVDILLLDIRMPLMTGMDLLNELPDKPLTILTTAYEEYAVKGYELDVIDYLLKPVDERELVAAVNSWRERRDMERENKQISALLDNLKKDGLLGNKVAVPVLDGFEFIDVKTILYCQSENNYTNIHFESGKTLLISKTLKEFEKVMEKFLFIRTHQSYLINPQYMRKYVRNDGGYIVLVNGKEIPVSSSRKRLIVGLFEAIKR